LGLGIRSNLKNKSIGKKAVILMFADSVKFIELGDNDTAVVNFIPPIPAVVPV
jgi:hypothetical protein